MTHTSDHDHNWSFLPDLGPQWEFCDRCQRMRYIANSVHFLSRSETAQVLKGVRLFARHVNPIARYAEYMATKELDHGNQAAERGNQSLSERHYTEAQKWHDLMNVALGNGDGTEA